MCYKVNCQKCGKPTWAGCGNHIEQALKDVPVQKRCQCKSEQSKDDKTKKEIDSIKTESQK